ncbi:MAG: hypothetical protein HeimC2_40640 [Candidatus Heimdallarchaeota archaeon LC_2]|nr:MAG: hypothetical protein HeimC2_40640 [Candidatus Heimdallarchaeota archaeon LC_2]
MLNLETDAEITSLYGFKTLDMTIDTSYHTFDLGPGGQDYGYNYIVDALDTAKLQSWYGEVGDTFDLGTHQWSFFGIDVPLVAPFAHDVNQVFTTPYLISAYKNVVEDAGAITRAKDSYFNATLSANVGMSLNIPAEIEVTYPNKVTIGTSNLVFKLIPDEIEAVVTFNYDLFSNISFSYWFLSANFEMANKGQTNVTMYDNTVSSVLENLAIDAYEQNDIPFNTYVTLDSFSITPTILGPIVSGEISLDLLSVIETVLVTAYPILAPVFKVIDFFLESISLRATAVLQTVLRHPLSSPNAGVTFDNENITYTAEALSQEVQMTIANDAIIDDGITIVIGDVNYVLDFTTEWDFVIEFKQPTSSFIDDISWNIGTYPSLSSDLISSAGTSINIPPEGSDSAGFDFSSIIIVGALVLVVFVLIKNRRKPKGPNRKRDQQEG